MANRHRGEVGLGDYKLRLSTNAICELEDATGKSIAVLGEQMGGQMSMKMLRAVVWASLQEHHPGTTEQDAGRIIDEVGFADTAKAISEAFKVAFPEPVQGQSDARPLHQVTG